MHRTGFASLRSARPPVMPTLGRAAAVGVHAILVSRPRLAAAACALIVATWALMAAWIVGLILYAITRTALLAQLIPALVGGSVILALLGALLSAFVYCPHCGRRFLLRSTGEKSINRARFRRVDSWASAVIEVLANQACRCIYCARRVAVPWRA